MKRKQRVISFLLALMLVLGTVIPAVASEAPTVDLSKDAVEELQEKSVTEKAEISEKAPTETPKEEPTEKAPTETSKEPVKKASVETPKEPVVKKTETSKETPAEAPKETSTKTIEETPKETPIRVVELSKKLVKVEATPEKEFVKEFKSLAIEEEKKLELGKDLVSAMAVDSKGEEFIVEPSRAALRATPKAAIPSELDGNKVETVTIEWLTQDGDNDPALLNLSWPSGNDFRKVRFRLNFALSGQKDYNPGNISIKLPKRIFRDRDGELVGDLSIAVPEAPDKTGMFSYVDLGDSYLITNNKVVAAASSGMIEGTIGRLTPSEIKDVATGYETDNLFAELRVITHAGNEIGLDSNKIRASVDTEASISGAYKRGNAVYENWPSSFPEEIKPANPEDYIYVKWNTYAYSTANQYFSVTFEDIANTGEGSKNGVLIGYRNSATGKVTKIDSQSSVSGENIFDGYIGNGRNFYLTFYTAYPKSDFEMWEKYVLRNEITYTLTARDDKKVTTTTASAQIPYEPVSYEKPTGHFIVNKWGEGPTTKLYGGKTEGIYGYALNELRDGKDTIVRYGISTVGFGEPWTLEKGTDPLVKENYNKVPYTLSTRDYETTFNFGPEMTEKDFEFKSIDIRKPSLYEYDKYESDGYGYHERNGVVAYGEIPKGSYGYKPLKDDSKVPPVIVYATINGKEIEVATVDFSTGTKVITPKNGATVTGSKLMFPANTTDYRMTVTTKESAVIYDAHVEVLLRATPEHVAAAEELFKNSDTPMTKTDNEVDLNVFTENASGGKFFVNKDKARDELQGLAIGAKLKKYISNQKNNVSDRVIDFTYNIKADIQTNVDNTALLEELIEKGLIEEERNQVWYDLLPPQVKPLIETLRVTNGKIVSRKVIQNYKNSGRDLLIVETEREPNFRFNSSSIIGTPGYGDTVTLSFRSRVTWEDLIDFGVEDPSTGDRSINLVNLAAYESKNSTLGTIKGMKGEPDDPSFGNNTDSKHAVSGYEDAMTNLNPEEASDPVFIYGRDNSRITADTSALISLSKRVDVNNENVFGDGLTNEFPKNVYEGEQYTYRFRVRNSPDSSSKDIVFYDNLEKYKPTSDKDDYRDITWEGQFVSLDISPLKDLGIDPKVYYSTKTGLVLDDEFNRADNDLSNTEIWSTTEPADKSTITAIAVDTTYMTNGEKFVLPKGAGMSWFIKMKAPLVKDLANPGEEEKWYDKELSEGENEEGLTGGAHAYNNAVITSITMKDEQESANLLVRNDYTKVGLLPYKLDVEKAWEDGDNRDGLRTDSVQVELVADGVPTGNIVELASEDSFKGTFGYVPYVNEQGLPIHYSVKELNTPKDYTVNSTVENTSAETAVMKVVNKHEPYKITLEGEKTWDENGKRPDYIIVDLYANGKRVKSTKVTSADDWKYTFKDLYKNEDGKEIEYTVKELYVKGFVPEYGKDSINIHNKYSPYADLTISKEVLNGTAEALAKEFTFVVEFTDENGELDTSVYTYEKSTGETGEVTSGGEVTLKDGESLIIKNIKSDGSYKITEKELPGFKKSVMSTGTSGTLKAGDSKEAHFINDYSTQGQVNLEVFKELTGRELKTNQFQFDVRDSEGNPVISGSNDREGKVQFGAIRYSTKDVGKTFEYHITERKLDLNGYTFDETVKKAFVKVLDNGDGTITAVPVYEAGDVTFRNTYEATGEVSVVAWKTMKNGLPMEDGEFNFELVDAVDETKVVATGKNTKEGKIEFSAIQYTQEDVGKTFEYFAKEIPGEDSKTIYDESKIKFTIEVFDNGDGTLSFEATAEDLFVDDLENDPSVPLFMNERKDGSLKVRKDIEEGDPLKEFRFRVTLTGTEGTVPAGTWELIRNEEKPLNKLVFKALSGLNPDNVYLETDPGDHTVTLPGEEDSLKWVIGSTVLDGGTTLEYTVGEDKTVVFKDSSIELSEDGLVEFVELGPCAMKDGYGWEQEGVEPVKEDEKGRYTEWIIPVTEQTPSGGHVKFYGEQPACGLRFDTGEVVNGDNLAKKLGLTAGNAFNSDGGWLRYELDGEEILVAKKPFRYNVSWNQINAVGAVDGSRTLTINGEEYSIRLMKGGELEEGHDSEWNKLILPIIRDVEGERYGSNTETRVTNNTPQLAKYNWFNENCNAGSTDEPNTLGANNYDCISNYAQGQRRWIQGSYGSDRVTRGSSYASNVASYWSNYDPGYTNSYHGWLPVLSRQLTTDYYASHQSSLPRLRRGDASFSRSSSSATLAATEEVAPAALSIEPTIVSLASASTPAWVNPGTVETIGNHDEGWSASEGETQTILRVVNYPPSFTVNFEKGDAGVTGLDEAPLEVSVGDSFTVPTPTWALEKSIEGIGNWTYTLKGFRQKGSSDTTIYAPGSTATISATADSTVTLEGVWELDYYKVNFDYNGPTYETPTKDIKVGAEVKPDITPLYFNHDFVGWSLTPDGEPLTAPIKDIAKPGEMITLYAIWTPKDNSVNIENGQFEFTLLPGESIEIPNLPAGISYKVEELKENGWVVVKETNTSNTIKPDTQEVASFVNSYNPGETNTQFSGKKLLDGKPAGNFSFLLKDASGATVGEAVSQADGNFVFPNIRYKAPGTYKYTIVEATGDDSAVTYDTSIYNVSIEVTDDGEGNLVASEPIYKKGSVVVPEVTFENTTKTGNLTIQKLVTGTNDTTKQFTFEVTIGSTVETVTLNNGGSKVYKNIKAGTPYSVKEVSLPTGYTLESITNASGSIAENSTVIVTAKNKYDTQGSFTVSATKELTGRDLRAGEFTFLLKDSAGTTVATATNTAEGKIEFGAIPVIKEGTAVYKLSELKGTDPTITYDTTIHNITVTSKDNGAGVITTEVSTGTPLVFSNKFTPGEDPDPSPKYGNFTITKEVVNETEAVKGKAFNIEVSLRNSEGDIVEGEYGYVSTRGVTGTVKDGSVLPIKGGETITVKGLPVGTLVDIKEDLEVAPGFTLVDTSIISGRITAETVAGLKLINEYNPTGGWKPTASKQLLGKNIDDYSFRFVLVQDGKLLQTKNNIGSSIEFDEVVYGIEDIGKTYTYEIYELAGRDPEIVYDKSIYKVTVEVTDDGEGNIVATPDITDISFSNGYRTMPSTGLEEALVATSIITALAALAVFRRRVRR